MSSSPPLEILGTYLLKLNFILGLCLVSLFSKVTFLLVREAEGFTVWSGPPFTNGQPTLKLERVSCSNTKFSVDGSKLMAMKSDGIISIYDATSLTEVRSFPIANATAAELSPCGTYLQTFQKPTTPQEKNVSIWNIETGDLAHSHYQKSITKASW